MNSLNSITTEELLSQEIKLGEEKKAETTNLKKKAGIFTVIALTFASMMGSGLFSGAGVAAAYAGPASLITWILLGIITVYVGMCFAELVALFPKAGGVYEFTKQSYGQFPSFIIGWLAWLSGNMFAAVLLIDALDYLILAFPSVFADQYTDIVKIILGVLIILVLNYVAFRGIEASGVLLGILAGASVLILVAIVVKGMFIVNIHNFTPFMPYSPVYIFLAMFFLMDTYFGWDGATYLAEEVENAEKIIPKVLISVCVVLTVLGFLTGFVLMGIMPLDDLTNSLVPAIDAGTLLFGNAGAAIVGLGVFFSIVGMVASTVVTSPRLLRALARDKLFIDAMAELHPKYGTPYKSIMFQTVFLLAMLFVGFKQYDLLLATEIPLSLAFYIPCICSVTVLRYKMPGMARPYKAPFGVTGPILVSLVYLSALTVWIWSEPTAFHTLLIVASLIALALPVYLLLTVYYNPDAIIPAVNQISTLQYWLEDFLLPRDIRKQVLALFDDYEGKNILEFGSGVGTMTMHLAELVKPGGHIYAVDLSKGNLKIIDKRAAKKGHDHIHTIHDEHQMNRVHPSVPKVDMIFSFGMLSYIQDLKKILKELHIRLPEGGQVCFIEYANLYKVLPNVGWLAHPDEVKQVFHENGFSVTVQLYKGLLWDYMVIYGIKSQEGLPYI